VQSLVVQKRDGGGTRDAGVIAPGAIVLGSPSVIRASSVEGTGAPAPSPGEPPPLRPPHANGVAVRALANATAAIPNRLCFQTFIASPLS
jgi:hypothetical protein